MNEIQDEYYKIKTIDALYLFMKKNIKYGFVSKIDNKCYRRDELNDDAFYDYMIKNGYYLQSPNELLKSRYGICYDQIELERKWFEDHNYEVYTYFSEYHNHGILIFKKNDKYYLMERSFPKHNGIYESNSLEECFEKYIQMQKEEMTKKIDEINIYPYKKPEYGLGFYEFIDNAKNDKKITLKIN